MEAGMKQRKKYAGMHIAVGGSAANPVTNAHKQLLEGICDSGDLDLVVWIPSGVRDDKPNMASSTDRYNMTELAFPDAWRRERNCELLVSQFDVLSNKNTPTINWIRIYQDMYPGAVIKWYTGVDSVIPRKKYGGRSQIQGFWDEGDELWDEHQFIVIPREGYIHPSELDLPEQFEILDLDIHEISSTNVRLRIIENEPFEELIPHEVAEYIKEKKLYCYDPKKRRGI